MKQKSLRKKSHRQKNQNQQQKANYSQNQAYKYRRMSTYSLDEDNKRIYKARATEWEEKANGFKIYYVAKSIANSGESSIIKKTNKAKAIDLFDDSDILTSNEYTKEKILEELKTSNIGNETIQFIVNLPERIKLIDSIAPEGVRGEEYNGQIKIYLKNCKNIVWVARTIIHEVTHYLAVKNDSDYKKLKWRKGGYIGGRRKIN